MIKGYSRKLNPLRLLTSFDIEWLKMDKELELTEGLNHDKMRGLSRMSENAFQWGKWVLKGGEEID